MKKTLLMLAGIGVGMVVAPSARSQVVIQNCANADIGNTNIFVTPVIITWNPCRAAQIDAIAPGTSRFFYAHEICHAAFRIIDEAAADICAARAVPPQTAQAAIRYFMIIAPTYPYLPRYGTAYDRARRIAAGAGLSM